jgi:hypothetical protein
MALVLGNDVYAIGGGTVAHAAGNEVRIFRGSHLQAKFAVQDPAWWLKVSPDGNSALIYAADFPRVWRWREAEGIDLWAASKTSRDSYGCGFLEVQGETLTLLAQDGFLRGFSARAEQRFAANLRNPSSFYPRFFAPLPGRRLALVGNIFGDSSDSVVTVEIDALLRHTDAVQSALRGQAPIKDRAVQLAVGAAGVDAAVVYRNPEQDEEADDDDDPADLGDIYGLAGLYLRNIENGSLIKRLPWSGSATSDSNVAATGDAVAIQVSGGIDLIQLRTGSARHIPGAILDPIVPLVVRVEPEGVSDPIAFDRL